MSVHESKPRIVVLGASGLIGQAVASQLQADGYPITAIARRFNAAQLTHFGSAAVERPIVELEVQELANFLSGQQADIVVNCIGVLQDTRRSRTEHVHGGFVVKLIDAIARQDRATLLVHVSIPGREEEDRTPFSITKRQAERAIADGPIPYVILRPGFVVAKAAYGGSALVRALAALPFALPQREAGAAFAVTDIADIARTIAFVTDRWRAGMRDWKATWDVIERDPSTLGAVLSAMRPFLGGPKMRLPVPSWALDLAAMAGDWVAYLGWMPPVRTTSLQEMRRGVSGDAEAWIAATGLEPAPLGAIVRGMPASVQEKWFARLYFAKPMIIGVLVVFWLTSGLIALTLAFNDATAILTAHGFPLFLAQAMTVVSSVTDISVGLAIAFKRTCRAGLLAGIGVSLFYMAGAALITPDLWIEPLGALVKTGPAIVLMLVALAVLDER
jgi:uncharacterized protein YbjT (DUF2867 family)